MIWGMGQIAIKLGNQGISPIWQAGLRSLDGRSGHSRSPGLPIYFSFCNFFRYDFFVSHKVFISKLIQCLETTGWNTPNFTAFYTFALCKFLGITLGTHMIVVVA
jgi:hypothetical protein